MSRSCHEGADRIAKRGCNLWTCVAKTVGNFSGEYASDVIGVMRTQQEVIICGRKRFDLNVWCDLRMGEPIFDHKLWLARAWAKGFGRIARLLGTVKDCNHAKALGECFMHH